MPLIAVSIGNVIRCSTSTGDRADTAVLICTWTFVMSGIASIGKRPKFTTPSRITARTPRTTSPRWAMENRIRRSNMLHSFRPLF